MNPMGTNDEEKQEELPGDYDTPFSEPNDAPRTLPEDHQAFETNVDDHQAYDEGIEGAAEQYDETMHRPVIRPVNDDPSRQNGPVRVIKPPRKSPNDHQKGDKR